MIAVLVGEGPSDRALVPVLRWLLADLLVAEFGLTWVDTRRFVDRIDLEQRIVAAVLAHPCDLIFVHRDADNRAWEERRAEVLAAARGRLHVPVVPVRSTESWLLVDEAAIRAAAGRVSGRSPLGIPPPRRLESVSNPKKLLHDALVTASGAKGRRAKRFDPTSALHRVADLVEDWSPLRAVPAFQRLEADTRGALIELGACLRTAR